MTTVNQKYLKDENGEVFSPIVSASSVYDRGGGRLDSNIHQLIFKVNTGTSTGYTYEGNLGEGHYQLIMQGAFKTNPYVRMNDLSSGFLFNLTHLLRNSDESVTLKSWSPPTLTSNTYFPFSGWNDEHSYGSTVFDIYFRDRLVNVKSQNFAYNNNNLTPTFLDIMGGRYVYNIDSINKIYINCGTNCIIEMYKESL